MTDSFEPDSPSEGQTQRPANGKLLAAGFGVGLLVGAFFLFSPPPAEDQTTVTAQPGQRSRIPEQSTDTTGVETSADLDDGGDVDPLTIERQRLKAELESLKLKQEVAALQRELNGLRTTNVSVPVISLSAPSGASTLAFWNRMNDVIEREGQMRSAPLGGITSANAGSFFDARIRAATFAVDALRALDPDGVDAGAVAVAESLSQWYEQGREVAESGRNLLTRGSTEKRKGVAGQQYQTAEREHGQSVDAVNAEGERVRQQLSNEYGIDFPPLK